MSEQPKKPPRVIEHLEVQEISLEPGVFTFSEGVTNKVVVTSKWDKATYEKFDEIRADLHNLAEGESTAAVVGKMKVLIRRIQQHSKLRP